MKKILINFLCCFIPFSRTRHRLKHFAKGCEKLIVIEDGKERMARIGEFPRIFVTGSGFNNIIKVELPCHPKMSAHISWMNSNNNCVVFHKNILGTWNVSCYSSDNSVEIGEETTSCDVSITLIGNKLEIGRDCMFSNSIRIWGDGHSVLDFKSGEVLNKPKHPIVIGDHCWIGERTTLTKGAQIPNNCIVGIASVVTKSFINENCLIAGSPACIKKKGITWSRFNPLDYERKIKEIIK